MRKFHIEINKKTFTYKKNAQFKKLRNFKNKIIWELIDSRYMGLMLHKTAIVVLKITLNHS